jgi:hypothetical protein
VFRTTPTTAYVLSAANAIRMALACTGGLLIDGLYQDNAFAAIDAFDDTPILDLKPHFPVSDRV